MWIICKEDENEEEWASVTIKKMKVNNCAEKELEKEKEEE